jgi:steroid 5-alpha reductase family enzyme
MLVTILILIFTIIVVPYISLYYGTPLTDIQEVILWNSSKILMVATAYCIIVGELARNNSQVDKLWSIIPTAYAWYITYAGGWNERMILMSILVTIWSIRLTYNFGRRGGYSWKFWAGEEDYRWDVLRQKPGFNNNIIWFLFNTFFICGYQMTLIYLFTVPILTGLSLGAPSLIWADYLLAVIFISFVIIEYIADQQQWDFQTEKYRRINANEELGKYAHGFVRKGLWGIVRHPNYMAEQAIWIVFYLFSFIATGEVLNWSIAGCLLLVILFKSSSDFSEEITTAKYPEYKDYQASVPRFIPFTKFKKAPKNSK